MALRLLQPLRFFTIGLLLIVSNALGWSSGSTHTDATPIASPQSIPTAVADWPAWIQLGPNDVILARAVRLSTCPGITIDGASSQMTMRAAPAANHPNIVCETEIPATASSVTVDGKSLPLPVPDPQCIAVLGDTGCRWSTATYNAGGFAE